MSVVIMTAALDTKHRASHHQHDCSVFTDARTIRPISRSGDLTHESARYNVIMQEPLPSEQKTSRECFAWSAFGV